MDDEEKDFKSEKHLNTLLLREAKLAIKNYEAYLLDKISSKELANKFTNLSLIIQRLEDWHK
jgi:hypothetical protein